MDEARKSPSDEWPTAYTFTLFFVTGIPKCSWRPLNLQSNKHFQPFSHSWVILPTVYCVFCFRKSPPGPTLCVETIIWLCFFFGAGGCTEYCGPTYHLPQYEQVLQVLQIFLASRHSIFFFRFYKLKYRDHGRSHLPYIYTMTQTEPRQTQKRFFKMSILSVEGVFQCLSKLAQWHLMFSCIKMQPLWSHCHL